jgi:hypothetical protein
MSDRPLRIILDTSAVIAYTEQSVDVGEVMSEIEDEVGGVGLPIMCLIEASHAVRDRDRLQVLVNHPAAVLLTTRSRDWQALAALYNGGIARIDAVQAAHAAISFDVALMTGVPGWYASMDAAGPPIIDFDL